MTIVINRLMIIMMIVMIMMFDYNYEACKFLSNIANLLKYALLIYMSFISQQH